MVFTLIGHGFTIKSLLASEVLLVLDNTLKPNRLQIMETAPLFVSCLPDNLAYIQFMGEFKACKTLRAAKEELTVDCKGIRSA